LTDSAVPLHFQFPPTINLPAPACVATPRLAYSRRTNSLVSPRVIVRLARQRHHRPFIASSVRRSSPRLAFVASSLFLSPPIAPLPLWITKKIPRARGDRDPHRERRERGSRRRERSERARTTRRRGRERCARVSSLRRPPSASSSASPSRSSSSGRAGRASTRRRRRRRRARAPLSSPTSSSSTSSSTASTSSPPSSSSTRPPAPSPSPSRRRLVRQRAAVGGARGDGVMVSTGQDSKCPSFVPPRGGSRGTSRSRVCARVQRGGVHGRTGDRTGRPLSDRRVTTGRWEDGDRPTARNLARRREGCDCMNERGE